MLKFAAAFQLLLVALNDHHKQAVSRHDEKGISVLEMVLIGAFVVLIAGLVFAAIRGVIDTEIGKIG